jgi:hypothetical protein
MLGYFKDYLLRSERIAEKEIEETKDLKNSLCTGGEKNILRS